MRPPQRDLFDRWGDPVRLPAPALLALAVSTQAARPRATFVLAKPEGRRCRVMQTVQADSLDEAVRLLPPHPDTWFVTSALALATLGPLPEPWCGCRERSCTICRRGAA